MVPESQKENFKKEMDSFAQLFSRFIDEVDLSIKWEKIQKLPEDSVLEYEKLPMPSNDLISQMLDELVVVKLNGGLGTSMGCYGPKSIITVRQDLTFLDMTVLQIEVSREKNSHVDHRRVICFFAFST